MVCGWAAESVVLIAVSERLLRRHGTRRLRLTVASGGYLLLAAGQTLLLTAPTEVHLAYSVPAPAGLVALGAVTLAGIVFCFGIRVFAVRELRFVWLLPAAALGYLPVVGTRGQWAVIAYAALAAALFGYRRSPCDGLRRWTTHGERPGRDRLLGRRARRLCRRRGSARARSTTASSATATAWPAWPRWWRPACVGTWSRAEATHP